MLERAARFIRGILGSKKREPIGLFDITIPCEPTLRFLVPINGAWASVAEHAATPSRLLGHYLQPDTSDEEVLAGAILVYADNRPWNTCEHSERLMHIESWLSAVRSLLREETSAFIWAWEESGMQAVRQDNLIILEERTHHRSYQLPPVSFELGKFAQELVKKTEPAVELVMGLKQVAQKLNPVEWRSAYEAEEARRALVRNTSSAPEVDHEKALVELRAFERRALKKIMSPDYQPPPPPSGAEDRAQRLREVLDYLAAEGLVSSWEKLKSQVEFVR